MLDVVALGADAPVLSGPVAVTATGQSSGRLSMPVAPSPFHRLAHAVYNIHGQQLQASNGTVRCTLQTTPFPARRYATRVSTSSR